MEILGYAASALIGLSLGLIGGGGSILTLPVLVYLFSIPATPATGYSLFIVGVTAAVGTIGLARRGEVDFRVAAVFGPPSILAVYSVRAWGMPHIPEVLGTLGGAPLTRDRALIVLFALLMVATATSMIRAAKLPESEPSGNDLPYAKVALEGLAVGSLTGLLGAGGGFLIIPALVLLAGLPMKRAIGTSLLLIATKSLIGFVGDVQRNPDLDWRLLVSVSAVAVGGIFVGMALQRRVSGERLKPAFGVFVLVMGALVLGREIVFPGPKQKGGVPANPPAVTRTLPR